MIPEAAIEALARVLANEELFRADCDGYGWDAETDSSDHFMPNARKKAARYLEAAAPRMRPDFREANLKAIAEELATPPQFRKDAK